MPIHDRYARVTPFERSFPDPDFAVERFTAIEEEAAARGTDLSDADAFVMLMATGQALRDLRDPGEDAERVLEHGALLYHSYHFWRHGRPLWLLSGAAARYLVEEATGSGEGWTPGAPRPAGYLQLPQHLFWTRSGPDEVPESLDGVYWVASPERLSVMAVMGMREDRPGFSVLPIPPVPLADARSWVGADIRGDGRDFESSIPGSELERLYELQTAGEALKLLARVFRLLGEPGQDRSPLDPPEPKEGPRPTALPWVPIRLD